MSMVSSEGERVQLHTPVPTKSSGGRVEIWLLQVRVGVGCCGWSGWCGRGCQLAEFCTPSVCLAMLLTQLEQGMRATMHDQFQRCSDSIVQSRSKRVDWIHSWPSQTVMAVNQLFWTRDVEVALRHTAGSSAPLEAKPLKTYLAKLNAQVCAETSVAVCACGRTRCRDHWKDFRCSLFLFVTSTAAGGHGDVRSTRLGSVTAAHHLVVDRNRRPQP